MRIIGDFWCSVSFMHLLIALGGCMDRTLIKDFWSCRDSQIIDFAIMRARLNKNEKDVLRLILDECMTQEQAAECMDISTRNLQKWWYSATDKLLSVEWVLAYAKYIREKK